MSLMTICVRPIILPAPIPWTALARISHIMPIISIFIHVEVLCAAPHNADPIKKMIIEPKRIGFLPNKSLLSVSLFLKEIIPSPSVERSKCS